MSDYIERADALKAVDAFIGTDPIANRIKLIPSADVAPVRHGHWIKHEGRNGAKDSIECSACGVWIDDMPRKTFCPNCNARMDSEKKNCDTCKHYDKGWDEGICDECTNVYSNWERKEDDD